MFENSSEFKQELTTLLKYFNIKPVLTSVKIPQADAPVQPVNQVKLNMLVTKDLDDKLFYYIDP